MCTKLSRRSTTCRQSLSNKKTDLRFIHHGLIHISQHRTTCRSCFTCSNVIVEVSVFVSSVLTIKINKTIQYNVNINRTRHHVFINNNILVFPV